MRHEPRERVLSVPGKTFLVGEYLALEGGPSILLSTEPRFQLRVTKKNARSGCFQPGSPAAHLLESNMETQKGWHFEFTDPHKGKGGLGASTAQFALAYAWLNRITPGNLSKEELSRALESYRKAAWSGEGVAPSGADLIAQLVGRVCRFDGRDNGVTSFDWAFPSLGFTLIRTGVKLATHEHLKIARVVPIGSLRECADCASSAFEKRDENLLVKAVNECGRVLESAGLATDATIGLLRALRSQVGPAIRAAKGCGAMGADIILVLHDRERSRDIETWAASKDLPVCGAETDLTGGLRIEKGGAV